MQMFIKVYIHPSKLTNIKKKESILAQQMSSSQYDIELFINTNQYTITYQSNGVLIKKKSILDRILRRK